MGASLYINSVHFLYTSGGHQTNSHNSPIHKHIVYAAQRILCYYFCFLCAFLPLITGVPIKYLWYYALNLYWQQ